MLASALPAAVALAVALAAESPGRALEAPLSVPAREAASALRAGDAARAKGAHAEAARRFEEAAAREPAVAAVARRLAAESWLAAGRPAEAEAGARAALAAPAPAPLAAALLDLVAQARSRVGDEAGAGAAWREALARGPDPEARETMRLALAASLDRAGAHEEAARTLVAVWREAPERPEAEEAGRRLEGLEARLGAALRSAGDQLQRADRLFEKQHSEAALASYDAALAGALAPPARDRARARRAHCLFRLRRYPEAETAFAALAPDPEARVWSARAQARAGAVEEATAALEQIGAEPLGETAAWARYLAGLLHEGRGRHARARALWASVAREPGSPKLAADATWRLAWTAYLARDTEEARERFLAYAKLASDPTDRLAARYWAARALEPSDAAAARTELGAVAREAPLGYYGWRAHLRAGAPAPAPPAEPLPRGARALDAAALLPARVLVVAGLAGEARGELRRLASRAGGLDDRVALGELSVAAGDYAGAQALVIGAYGDRLARGPAPGEERVFRLAWPAAFEPEVRAALAREARIPAELVLALVREESGYRPDAVSVSGAIGLMQLLPTTASRVAAELGEPPPGVAALVEPGLNLRLGTAYLDHLMGRFEGALAAAVAAYNAGPEPVSEWIASGPREEDEWVEAIPYVETRGYVKRVLRSLHVYRTLRP
jgi:soluble lytic murein transglycosylase